MSVTVYIIRLVTAFAVCGSGGILIGAGTCGSGKWKAWVGVMVVIAGALFAGYTVAVADELI
jgi:hypothetical protein